MQNNPVLNNRKQPAGRRQKGKKFQKKFQTA